MKPRHLSLLYGLLALGGCSGQSGGEAPFNDDGGAGFDSASPDPSIESVCELIESRSLELDERAPIGFSARQMLDIAEFVHRESLAYSDGTQSALRLSLSYSDGAVVFLDRERPSESAGPSSDCPDSIEVTVSVDLVSEDGRFDESFDTVLTATQANQNSIFVELDPDRLSGSFRFEDFDDTSYDRRRLFVDGVFDAQGSRGRLTGRGETDGDPQDPDSTSQATNVPIGGWPADDQQGDS